MTRVCKLDALGGMSYLDVNVEDPYAMHNLLRGYMESFPLPSHLAERSLWALCDEDGLFKDLPYNAYSPLLGRQIVGTVIIARSEEPEFVDLTDEDVAALDEWFGRLIVVTLGG